MHEVFTKTRPEDVDLPHIKRRNSSFYRRKDNNGAYIRRGDLTEGFSRYEFVGVGDIFEGACFRNFTAL